MSVCSVNRRVLYEVPVGFKWFADGLFEGSLGFGGEESAGASFLRKDGSDPSRWHLTATIMTRPAVGEIADIHDRTPVTLPFDMIDDWIDPRTVGDKTLVDAAVAAATPVAESLQFHRIASPIRGDSPEMIQPV